MEYKIDDSIIYDNIDESLARLDLKYLMKAKLEMMKEGKDTSILDKAINERKRRDKKMEEDKKRRIKQEEKMKRQNRRAILFGLLDGLTSSTKSNDSVDDGLMSWEKDAIKNNGYESHNFEEEDLEEDDYYFEDED